MPTTIGSTTHMAKHNFQETTNNTKTPPRPYSKLLTNCDTLTETADSSVDVSLDKRFTSSPVFVTSKKEISCTMMLLNNSLRNLATTRSPANEKQYTRIKVANVLIPIRQAIKPQSYPNE